MKVWGLILSLVFLAGCNDSEKRDNKTPVKSVEAVDVDRYAGEWFVAAKMPAFFEKDCKNSSAKYEKSEDGTKILVTNTCENKETGELEVIEGTATPVDSTNAKLKVRLGGVPVAGDYWVVNLDEQSYQWAIVSEPKGRYLWVLSRTKKMDPATLSTLVGWVEADGWDMSQLIFDNGN